jgi:hypothetical protein
MSEYSWSFDRIIENKSISNETKKYIKKETV